MAEEIVLVRHGETEWSRTLRHTGRTDVPLTDEGRRQAEIVGRALHGRRFELVLTSPLQRAAETCRLAGFGAEAQARDDLCEWDYGDYEGRTTPEIRIEGIKTDVVALYERLRYCTEQEKKKRGVRVFDVEQA